MSWANYPTCRILSNNDLTGEIPPELGKLSNLTENWGRLDRARYRAELGNLANLREILQTSQGSPVVIFEMSLFTHRVIRMINLLTMTNVAVQHYLRFSN